MRLRSPIQRLSLPTVVACAAAWSVLSAQPQWYLAHTWPPLPANIRFDEPSSVAIDGDGRLLVLQRGDPALLRFNKDGTLDQAWGGGFYKGAHGLEIAPDGAIWTTDRFRNVLVKYAPDGRQLQIVGTLDEQGADDAHFAGVADLAFLPNGDFYVADGYVNARVVKFDREGRYQFEWGRKGNGPGEFNLPHAIALDSTGRVYVGDRENARVQVFDGVGRYLWEYRHGKPFGLHVSPDNELWIADAETNQVVHVDRGGKVVERFEPTDRKAGDLTGPHMITLDRDGAVYLAETRRLTVRKFVKR